MVRLRVVSRYRAGPLAYEEGQIIDVAPEFAEFLQRDAPGVFVPDEGAGQPAPGEVTRPARGTRSR